MWLRREKNRRLIITMTRIVIGVSIALLCIGLVPARSESVGTKPGRRVTLLLKTPALDSWEKAIVSFRPKEVYDGSKEPQNEWDLLYGGLSHNGDANWLKVNCDKPVGVALEIWES